MVSKASELLPEPDSPVITISRSRGRSRSMFLRLWVRAPRMRIVSMDGAGGRNRAFYPFGPDRPRPPARRRKGLQRGVTAVKPPRRGCRPRGRGSNRARLRGKACKGLTGKGEMPQNSASVRPTRGSCVQNNYRGIQVMYAVVVTGGKQYRVMQGETLRVEKIDAEAGKSIDFTDVLLLGDGEKVTVGAPTIKG